MNFAEEYMDRAELARQIGVDVRTLDRWHRERRGPPRTVLGALVFYRTAAVRAWMLSREQIDEPAQVPPVARQHARARAR